MDLNKDDLMTLVNILSEVYERNIIRRDQTTNIIKKEILTKQNKFIEKILSKRRD